MPVTFSKTDCLRIASAVRRVERAGPRAPSASGPAADDGYFPWSKVEFGCVIAGETAKIYGGHVNLHGPDGGRYEYAPSGGFESFSPTDDQVAYARWTFATNVVDVLVGSYPGADTDAIAYFKLYTFAKTGTALSVSAIHHFGAIEVTPRQME